MSDASNQTVREQMTAAPAEKKSGCGKCLLVGCVVVLVLGVVGAVGLYIAVPRIVRHYVAKFTDTEPVALPKVEVTDAQFAALQARTDAFEQTAKNNQAAELRLSGDDINALIAKHPGKGWKTVRDKLFVSIEDDRITGQLSVSLDSLATDEKGKRALKKYGLAGRYLNAKGTFLVTMLNGYLVVRLDQASVKGQPVPEAMMEGIRQRNLAEDPQRSNPDFREMLRKFETLEVKDSFLIIKTKAQPAAPAPERPAPTPKAGAKEDW